jgi:hypothetical protein
MAQVKKPLIDRIFIALQREYGVEKAIVMIAGIKTIIDTNN